MSYPSILYGPEDLAAFSFAIDPQNPNVAFSVVYPTLSFRYKCESCGVWADSHNGKCKGCFIGKPPKRQAGQRDKLYLCCDDLGCEVRQEAFSMLGDAGMPLGIASDGFGATGYVMILFPKDWSEQDRVNFNLKLSGLCVSKFQTRKLDCNPNKNLRSKLAKYLANA